MCKPLPLIVLFRQSNTISRPLHGIGVLVLHLNRLDPAYCHHALNKTRPLEWCRLRVVQASNADPSRLDGVLGYLTPTTHTCVARTSLFTVAQPGF